MNMPKNVVEYIQIANLIPLPTRQKILELSTTLNWDPHVWYNREEDKFSSHKEKELQIAYVGNFLHSTIAEHIREALQRYSQNTGAHSFSHITPTRLNHYPTNTLMRPHVDHIHSIFDGQRKGIPILSVVGLLNEDYEGGEFVFFDDHEVKLRAGDIMIFPSNFMYPHEVREITKGDRYSFVSWVF